MKHYFVAIALFCLYAFQAASFIQGAVVGEMLEDNYVERSLRQKSKGRTERCPPKFDEENPIDENREKDIENEMMESAKVDPIVRNLLLKAGRRVPQLRDEKTMNGEIATYTIPVVFHIFTRTVNGRVRGNVPRTAITKQISVMNSAFKTGGFQFTLQDVKVYSESRYFSNCDFEETSMKAATAVSPEKYLNIWSCDSQYLGFAVFPWSYSDKSTKNGVVMDYLTFPKVTGYNPLTEYDEGDTLVHEVGHFFGLFHTFQGGCTRGDEISDTPAEKSAAYGRVCQNSKPRDTCRTKPGVDPVRNYMDYTDDVCLDHFTDLQYARMRTMAKKYKPSMTK